jgi:hypothetical protein
MSFTMSRQREVRPVNMSSGGLTLFEDLKFAHCDKFDFPNKMTPALLSLAAIVESRGRVAPSKE